MGGKKSQNKDAAREWERDTMPNDKQVAKQA